MVGTQNCQTSLCLQNIYLWKRLKRYCKRLQMRYNKVSRKRGNKKMIRVMTKSIKNKEVIVLLPLGSEFLSF